MEIGFSVYGEYDELTKPDGETVGILFVRMNKVIIHEEECHVLPTFDEREAAINDVVKRLFAMDGE